MTNREGGLTVRDILGPAWARAWNTLRAHHIRRCVATALVMAWAMSVLPVAAQNRVDEARLPDADDTFAAFQALRVWVDEFETPRMDAAESRFTIRGATGVCVILRRSGRVLGVGTDTGGDDLMLRRAAGRALNNVLSDPALASLSARLRQQEVENPDTALTVDAFRAELGRTLAIEVEVAGRLTPLVGRALDQMARKLEPGLDGVALRHQQSLELTFPAQSRATNTGGDPARLLLNLALKAGLPVKDVAELPSREDFTLYSFRTVTLWQGGPGQAPIRTFRGDALVPQDAVTTEAIAEFADGLASRLLGSMWPDPPPLPNDPEAIGPRPQEPPRLREPLGIMGDYSIVADQYRPPVAPPLDQALVAFALNRYALASGAGLDEITAAKSLAAAAQILRDLAIVNPGEEDPRADLAACAAIVYAVTEQPGARADAQIEQLFNDASRRVHQSFDASSGFIDRVGDEGGARGVPAHTQAMLAGAMTRLLAMPNAPVAMQAERVRQAIDAAWQSVAQPRHVALLPWIGWAEMDFARTTGETATHIDELRLLMNVLDQARIGRSGRFSVDAAPDLLGGFALMADASPGTAMATAQTVRPAAWIAGAIRQPELIPADGSDQARQRHLETMRFLMQLSVREEHRGWLRNPSRALGGLRAALWDSDQPVPAQALGLIAAIETLRTLAEHPQP